MGELSGYFSLQDRDGMPSRGGQKCIEPAISECVGFGVDDGSYCNQVSGPQMNILIAGATSIVGQAIAMRFAPDNRVVLLSRNHDKSENLRYRLMEHGADSVQIVTMDLGDPELVSLNNIQENFDLFIYSACSTSQLRDHNVDVGLIDVQASIDLMAPVKMTMNVMANKRGAAHQAPLRVIFVSTILASIISPNRRIYASYKVLTEEYLKRICGDQPDEVKLLIIRIATFISPKKESVKADKLADGIYAAFQAEQTEYLFGFSGRMLKFIFFLQPWLVMHLLKLIRRLRSSLGSPIK